MTPAFRLRRQISIEAALDRGKRLQVRAEGQHIGVVMPPPVLRHMLAPGRNTAHARHLVGGNRDPHAAAADEDAQGFRARRHGRVADRRGEFRIIDARLPAATVIDAGMAEFLYVGADLLFELESAMVAAEVNFHAFLPAVASTSRLTSNSTICNAAKRS